LIRALTELTWSPQATRISWPSRSATSSNSRLGAPFTQTRTVFSPPPAPRWDRGNPNPFKPTGRLLTSGALGVSRNPIYAGGTVGLLGLALLLDTATGVAAVIVLGLLAHNLTLAEERYLEAKFGDEYRQYRSRVRRYI